MLEAVVNSCSVVHDKPLYRTLKQLVIARSSCVITYAGGRVKNSGRDSNPATMVCDFNSETILTEIYKKIYYTDESRREKSVT